MFVFFVLLISTAVFISETLCESEYTGSSVAFSSATASSLSSSSSSAFATAFSSSSSNLPSDYNDCTPTCSQPDPPNCPEASSSTPDTSKCDPGYILSEKGGQCVKIEECQQYSACKGDSNATYTSCPRLCISTCSKPNGSPCKKQCASYGCQCNPLYVISDEGKCISPDDCPGGNPCGQNKTFVYCNVKCPQSYCPVNDNRGIIACSPPYPCPSGCSCKANYKWLSTKEDRCVLASECPPVNCTRPNEVWNSCTPPCFTDKCRDLNQPSQECMRYGPECQPQCVCQDGYRRNDNDICVPISDCASGA